VSAAWIEDTRRVVEAIENHVAAAVSTPLIGGAVVVALVATTVVLVRFIVQGAAADRIRAKLDEQIAEWMSADPDTCVLALGRSEGLADALAILTGGGEGGAEWGAAADRWVARKQQGQR
jgi:hypothetical protein